MRPGSVHWILGHEDHGAFVENRFTEVVGTQENWNGCLREKKEKERKYTSIF